MDWKHQEEMLPPPTGTQNPVAATLLCSQHGQSGYPSHTPSPLATQEAGASPSGWSFCGYGVGVCAPSSLILAASEQESISPALSSVEVCCRLGTEMVYCKDLEDGGAFQDTRRRAEELDALVPVPAGTQGGLSRFLHMGVGCPWEWFSLELFRPWRAETDPLQLEQKGFLSLEPGLGSDSLGI